MVTREGIQKKALFINTARQVLRVSPFLSSSYPSNPSFDRSVISFSERLGLRKVDRLEHLLRHCHA